MRDSINWNQFNAYAYRVRKPADKSGLHPSIYTLLRSTAVVSFLPFQAQSHLQFFSRQRFMIGEFAAW